MGFNSIFWGFLFFFDFRVNGFDILPDIIGYLLIYSGLRNLVLENGHFASARKFALPLIFLSILDIYQVQSPANQISSTALLFLLVGIAVSIIHIYMVYHLCYGIAEKARQANEPALETTALGRWKYFLFYQILLIVFLLAGIIAIPIIALLFIPMFIFSIVILALLMGLMRQAEEKFGNRSQPPLIK